MKILFIGGTGNISTAVSRLCVAKGYDLYLLNRGTRGVTIPGTRVLTGDIANGQAIGDLLRGHRWDVVVDWIAYRVNDIDRDLAYFRGTTKQYIFISSASAYEKPPSSRVISESTPLSNPFWEYSRDKIACEDRLHRAYADEAFPVTIVRPSHTYDTVIPAARGGWTEYTLVDRMKKGKPVIVHDDGTSLWTLTHADDFARGFVGLLGREQAIGEAFHITSSESLTWNQIYNTIADAAGCEANLLHIPSEFIANVEPSLRGPLWGDKSYSAVFDNSKVRGLVPEFECTIPFSVGIRRTLAWLEQDPSRKFVSRETNDMMDRVIRAYADR